MVFAAETSRNCNSVTSNFCSFRTNLSFPRPWAAQCIKENLFFISYCTFFSILFFSKGIPPSKTLPKSKLSCFCSRVVTCPGKFSASFMSSLSRPLFAATDERHVITQKYFLTECIFLGTDFFDREGLIFRYVICVKSSFSMCNFFYFLKSVTPLQVIMILTLCSTCHLSVRNFEKKWRKGTFYIFYPRFYPDKRIALASSKDDKKISQALLRQPRSFHLTAVANVFVWSIISSVALLFAKFYHMW